MRYVRRYKYITSVLIININEINEQRIAGKNRI